MSSKTANKYSNASKLYDIVEWPLEHILFNKLRKKAVDQAKGKVLEVGAGTGKNFPYYDRNSVELTAIDFSEGMLEFAQKKRTELQWHELSVLQMDVEQMEFADNTFDCVVSTFVFCTVPHPQQGLKEIMRVLKPGGKAIFLEHMKSRYRVINFFLLGMNLVSSRLLGTFMLRETQKTIEQIGFEVMSVEYNFFDVIRLIIARKAH